MQTNNPSVHLQQIGNVHAIPARDVRIGDRLMYNFGVVATVTNVTPNDKQTSYLIETQYPNGERFSATKRASTLCAYAVLAPRETLNKTFRVYFRKPDGKIDSWVRWHKSADEARTEVQTILDRELNREARVIDVLPISHANANNEQIDPVILSLKAQIVALQMKNAQQRQVINTIRALNMGAKLSEVVNHIFDHSPASLWEDHEYFDTYWNQRRALLAIAEHGTPTPSKTIEQAREIARAAISGKKVD